MRRNKGSGTPRKYMTTERSILIYFERCHSRVKYGKAPSIEWPQTDEGYTAFYKEIGPKPDDIKKWSIGRKDHNLGYVTGNIQWEEFRFNAAKTRNNLNADERRPEFPLAPKKPKWGSPEHIAKSSSSALKQWADPAQRQKMKLRDEMQSKRMRKRVASDKIIRDERGRILGCRR